MLKWLKEKIENYKRIVSTVYITNISTSVRFCTMCGKQFVVYNTIPEGVFDPSTGKEYVSYFVGCPSYHEKMYFSTNPKYSVGYDL
jgi:hypothetical protein